MAIIKCKMCGGDLNITEGMSVAECEYCGTKQTVPNADNEKKVTLFGRANRLRLVCEFDKAASVYESIVAEFSEEAEAYWGLVLCRYGIEYVDDPATGKKVPTCHRSSFESILEDTDFEQACENADTVARKVYREEAKAIEEIRKGILEVSGKELPYDIFICYKETDENGERTVDSVLAQDVYDSLVEKGYRVFFSRITLEDKLGTEYEPYIFAALNSAKVMLVFGTDYEYFNAVWVKNEWSRFLKLMAQDKTKHLIPCYKDVDAYDMPKEFQKLQAQDMGKVGAVQDLLRGIAKLLGNSQAADPVKKTVVVQQTDGVTADSLLRRGQLFLEDGNWKDAEVYFDKVLDINPECAEAYVGKLCAEYHCETAEKLQTLGESFSEKQNYKKAVRFASADLREQLVFWDQSICDRLKEDQERVEAARIRMEEERARAAEKGRQNAPRLREIRNSFDKMKRYIVCCNNRTVGLKLDGTVVAAGDNDQGLCNVEDWTDIVAVSCDEFDTFGLKSDGTVVTTGDKGPDVDTIENWTTIVSIVCGGSYTVGIRKRGLVVATGENKTGQCDVSDWVNIVDVVCGESVDSAWTVGLREDGTVVAAGGNNHGQCNVEDWNDIVAVACGYEYTVGLRKDGTVVAAGGNNYGQCNVDNWSEIVSIVCGGFCTIGLRSDGLVVAVGENATGQCNVEDWNDIVAVACGYEYTVGLRADGTVVATGANNHGQCNVASWTDIVAVACGFNHTVGLKADGTVVAAGNNDYGKCNVGSWKLFRSIDTIEQELEKEKQECERRAKAERRQRLESQYQQLQSELSNIKGLFSGGRRKRIEAGLAEIEAELKKLQ